MRKTLRAKYIASEIHALLFVSMWALSWAFSQPLLDGLSFLPFIILFVVDLPISFIVFGVMFTSTKWGPIAGMVWGVLGTLWWYGIGYAIDTRIRNYRMKRGKETETVPSPTAGKIEFAASRKRELLIAVIVVALVSVASFAWQWNGRQGSFDSGKIGNFAFAPDGQSVVFVRSQGRSSLVENVVLASGASTPIGATVPCTATSLTYSPDGKQIAFVCEGDASEHSRIEMMNANGRNLHSLFSVKLDHDIFAPHFTADGKEIYFARSSPFATHPASEPSSSLSWDVYAATTDGSNEHALTNQHFTFFRLAFSSDGKKLIFSEDTGIGTQLRLFLLDDQSKGETSIQPVIANGRFATINNVVFASDGPSIYFLAAINASKEFGYDVYRSNLANNAAERLTTANGYATDLCVSSDGKTAVFLRWTARWGSIPNLARLYVLDLSTKRITETKVTGTQ
jgi:Tol biopolymer transport system component